MGGILYQAPPQGLLSEPEPQGLMGALYQNPLMARQMAAQRAANPRPDVTDLFGYGPNWTSYLQNLNQNLQAQLPQLTDSGEAMASKGLGLLGNFAPFGMTSKIGGMKAKPIWLDDLTSAGGKVDDDGTMLVWHSTTKDKADQILKEGVMRRPADAPDSYGVYFGAGRKPEILAESYGDGTLVPMRVRASDLNIEDLYKDRLATFYAHTKDGVYKPLAIGDEAINWGKKKK